MSVPPLQKIFFLACMVLLTASAVCAEPANHATLMANGEYKQAFDAYSATLQEAKTRLGAKDFAAVRKAVQAEMEDSVKEDVASGTAEAEAWSAVEARARFWLCTRALSSCISSSRALLFFSLFFLNLS